MGEVKLLDYEFKILSGYNNPLENEKWFELLNIKKVHEEGFKGEGIKIAILDTGVDESNVCFQNKQMSFANFTPEFGTDYNTAKDYNGHGSNVASIITTITPNAELLICKCLTRDGGGSMESIIAALDCAINNNVNIINMSLGATMSDDRLYNLVLKAIEKDISIVCAAGNNGDGNGDTYEHCFPGCYTELIQVGACSVDDERNIARFSNANLNIDCMGYGVDIVGAYLNGQFAKMSGTSQASPTVAGFLALLKQKYEYEFKRKLSESELYGCLIKNTITNPNLPRSSQGFGFIKYIDTK